MLNLFCVIIFQNWSDIISSLNVPSETSRHRCLQKIVALSKYSLQEGYCFIAQIKINAERVLHIEVWRPQHEVSLWCVIVLPGVCTGVGSPVVVVVVTCTAAAGKKIGARSVMYMARRRRPKFDIRQTYYILSRYVVSESMLSNILGKCKIIQPKKGGTVF